MHKISGPGSMHHFEAKAQKGQKGFDLKGAETMGCVDVGRVTHWQSMYALG